jgi:hypothetical protein
MSNAAETAWNAVERAKKQMREQEARIAHQRAMLAALDDGQYAAASDEARGLLQDMEAALAHMTAAHAAAEAELARATVDEPSLAKVERDCPM